MLKRTFGILIVAMTLGFSLQAMAEDPCSNAQLDAVAKRTLDRTENLLKNARPDLYRQVSSSGVGTCEPTSLYRAGANPGESLPHIRMQDTCGAVLTFKNRSDMHDVARYLRGQNLGGAVCVSVNIANPHGGVTSGN